MFLANLANGGATPALIATMSFNEARLGMISDNVANVSTPGYRAKQLDPEVFQASLREAMDRRGHRSDPFVVQGNRQAVTLRDGSLRVTPSDRPVDNILFHDGTNLSVEREMSDLAETLMSHEFAATLLRGNFDGLRKAIRGTL